MQNTPRLQPARNLFPSLRALLVIAVTLVVVIATAIGFCAGLTANLAFERHAFAVEPGYHFQRRAVSGIQPVKPDWAESTGLHGRDVRRVYADR